MKENEKGPIKVSVDMSEKTIIVSKGYTEMILTENDCEIIRILYDNILKENKEVE